MEEVDKKSSVVLVTSEDKQTSRRFRTSGRSFVLDRRRWRGLLVQLLVPLLNQRRDVLAPFAV
jgi:hypothetical protein